MLSFAVKRILKLLNTGKIAGKNVDCLVSPVRLAISCLTI